MKHNIVELVNNVPTPHFYPIDSLTTSLRREHQDLLYVKV